ncbi:hypothetical protein [Bradyrhizobium sp. G127]|uniref:hypothetical protein n=1 Tax=Bradyrhizobium sp. G127 TaxID=2904800 RepID=UPI001F18AB2F|nr:hypothetical protein [Bradyrhizobium sp. G127]MCF2523217.1 hypothetical protein [Bradyrhizobium sp. G127]
MIETITNTPVHDAMYAMSLAKSVPDAELLDEFVRRYPQHADALTEFAVELAVDALLHDDDEFDVPADPDAVSPVVSRVMSRFENRLFEVQQESTGRSSARMATAAAVNPFVALDREGFRALASRLNVNTVLLSKLRDRQIDPATIPGRFRRHVAEEIEEPFDVIETHLCAPQEAAISRQFYKSDGKPSTQPRQSFEDAVQNSGLSQDQQRHLLSFRD